MKIGFVERQPARVAYLRASGEPPSRFWRGVVGPWLAEHGLLDCPRYGVIAGDQYGAGIELPRGMTLPDVAETMIAGGRYAITHFKGGGQEIAAAWSAFTAQLLAGAGNRVDRSRAALEHMPRGAFH